MKELGVIFRYGRPVTGYEKEALELFDEAFKFFGEKLADGTLTVFEPVLFQTGDMGTFDGFFFVKGPEAKIRAFMEDEKRMRLQARTMQVSTHFAVDFLTVGEDLLKQVQVFAEANKVLVPA